MIPNFNWQHFCLNIHPTSYWQMIPNFSWKKSWSQYPYWWMIPNFNWQCFALNWTPMLWSIDTCQKNVIHWPVSCDHITGSSLVFIKVMCLVFKLTTDQGLVFSWITGSCQVNLLKMVWNQVKANQAKHRLHCEQMFCIAFVVCSYLRLFKLQTEGQIIYRKLQNSNQNSCLSWVGLIKL